MKLPRQPVLKLKQAITFVARSQTPAPLIRDLFRLQDRPYRAVDPSGITMELRPRRGEYFFFYDNVINRDCLRHGIALAPGATVLDVGANIGSFAIVAGRLVGPGGVVHAFEPDPMAFERLCRNVELNGLANVHCYPLAIGGRTGSFEFYTHRQANFSSLLDGVDTRNAGEMMVTTVTVRTLADVIAELGLERIDLLKVDCEGAEHEIVDTLDADTAEMMAQLVMETHAVPGRSRSALIRRLSELGFAVRGRGVPRELVRAKGRPALVDPHPSRPLPKEPAESVGCSPSPPAVVDQ
ncbi:FkbM family methyltransferase [Tautonia sociabilis]|uniref:FkbM family methyltransferase n=1 Tax=Tautonia sociabilis TaxID=2080755 RepID=A0A432MFE3_9BACT|nr:FkbM family methyltransferase [Tautonia sociabilis]RUL84921.1 FkbM family methyltransferase [Tautonia sociabilis]